VLPSPRARIGRSRNNDIIFADSDGAASSGHHAEATFVDGTWWIRDLGSRNGTRLNGIPITRAAFRAGDHLQFGDIECQVLGSRFGPAAVTSAVVALAAIAGVAFVLNRSAGPDFRAVAASIARSVYVVAADDNGRRDLIGTAFVVSDRMLATNAHVAAKLDAPGRRAIVIRGDSGEVHAITAVHLNQRWRTGSIADDVALLTIDRLPDDARPLVLASEATLSSLTRGTAVATFGFPMAATDPSRPRGRLVLDVLGDVRDGRYLGVGLQVAPGTSGSPIFLADGGVIGLVAGGDFTIAATGARSPSGTNVNWGISVAPLRELIRDCEAAMTRPQGSC
jgi:hypothetical protein